ncbi:MAG: hypothetical protein LC664_07955, partial [Flavobacteriales bacterium]|nr:hypothetical protein [Flavobacteriales bacterium]
MIVRRRFQLHTALRYSWKNILISLFCASLAYFSHYFFGAKAVVVPIPVVAILGTALAIILGFKNSSAYERWWEARKIWGGIVNESRTLTRQVLTIVDPKNVPQQLWDESIQVVQRQLAWIHALRLQLRNSTDEKDWKENVADNLSEGDYALISQKSNKVTWLAMLQGDQIKEMNVRDDLDTFSYIQMDDTLTRLTDLQG